MTVAQMGMIAIISGATPAAIFFFWTRATTAATTAVITAVPAVMLQPPVTKIATHVSARLVGRTHGAVSILALAAQMWTVMQLAGGAK